MINSFIRLLAGGARYLREHPQLVMTIVLMIVVPVAFLINGQKFLSASRANQETLEKDRIGLMHDLFGAYLRSVSFDPELTQNEIQVLAVQNPDINKFRVVEDTPNGLFIIAALNPDVIGKVSDNEDTYRVATLNPSESIINHHANGGVRYWQGFRLVMDESGTRYYIFTETSLEHIDRKFADRIMTAYYWLIGLIILIIALLFRHVRIIDYSHLYRETKKANEMKDLFTNMIAHELRAPLTAMRGYASMIIEDQTVPESGKKYANNITTAAERLLLIVNDLLDVARIQSGKLTVGKEYVDISKIVVDVIEELRPNAEGKNISLEAEAAYHDVTIVGDEKRLHQALTNIVSNAIKYTERGFIRVSLEKRRDRIELRVKDTGMGIASSDQQKLFAPFFRVENDATHAITGTGLGMWITKQLIELMGGSVTVESIRNVGTHVVVTLPLSG